MCNVNSVCSEFCSVLKLFWILNVQCEFWLSVLGDHISGRKIWCIFYFVCVLGDFLGVDVGIGGSPQELTLYDVGEYWFLMFGCFEWRPRSDLDQLSIRDRNKWDHAWSRWCMIWMIHDLDYESSSSCIIQITHDPDHAWNFAWSKSRMIRILHDPDKWDRAWSASWMTQIMYASSRSCVFQIMHDPENASSKSWIIQITHDSDHAWNFAWSKSRMIRIIHDPDKWDRAWSASWMTQIMYASSRSCVFQIMHDPENASSKSCIIQIMHHPDHASSRSSIIQIMHHPDHASSISCRIQTMHHPNHAWRSKSCMMQIMHDPDHASFISCMIRIINDMIFAIINISWFCLYSSVPSKVKNHEIWMEGIRTLCMPRSTASSMHNCNIEVYRGNDEIEGARKHPRATGYACWCNTKTFGNQSTNREYEFLWFYI